MIGLAPMAGYTDAPFRLICSEFGADFTVTEMISSDGLVRNTARNMKLLERFEGEAPLGVQLFGSDPETMARAASIATESRPAFIDLNFGCPAKKVVRRNCGAAVMRDTKLMGLISKEVVRTANIPVTAKIRSGWSHSEENFIEAGKVLEESGVSAVTIHPRYKTQGFSGSANWEHIARLNEVLSIPVIANGDVRSAEDYERIVETTGCSIVMIGRGAFGRPWIFRRIKDGMGGNRYSPPGAEMRIDTLERHVRMEAGWKGERRGILEMRKHYRWYIRGLPGMKDYRSRLSASGTLDEVLDVLTDLKEEIGRKWKRTA